jgi:hypothetical protein
VGDELAQADAFVLRRSVRHPSELGGGLSYKETARALRIREGTVMSRLYRARQQVVKRIEGG